MNSIRLIESKGDIYSEAIREMDSLKQKGSRFDTTFPFLLAYLNNDEYLFVNHCLVAKNRSIFTEINKCFKYLKNCRESIVAYYQRTLCDYYENVSYMNVKRTKDNIIALRGDYIPAYLETNIGKLMTKEDYRLLRIYCYKTWKVESENRRVLGDKAFREFIKLYGFYISTVVISRITHYTIVKG